MTDTIDMASAIEAETIGLGIARAAIPIEPGTAGECEQCEWWMPRLVGGLCAFCRDGRRRPADWEPPVPPHAHKTNEPNTAEKEADMRAKSIQIPASADDVIAAIEAHARDLDVSLGLATASLIKRGMSVGRPEAAAPAAIHAPLTIDELLDRVRELFAARDQSALDAANSARELAEARADAAEAKLVQAKALFA